MKEIVRERKSRGNDREGVKEGVRRRQREKGWRRWLGCGEREREREREREKRTEREGFVVRE